MKYVYGPVKSRRMGFSLGVSLTPFKVCDFDCIYCQLGPTKEKTAERKEYIKSEEIIEEVRQWLQDNTRESAELNFITLSGLGEPTLNVNIGAVIERIKGLTKIPLAVITNSSLFSNQEVRKALSGADLVVPSLDAVSQEVFMKIDRPLQGSRIDEILSGLVNFRKEFKGKIWLEVMLVSGVNDDLRQIKRLKEAVDLINPDKIQLNSPVRSTPAQGVSAVDKNKLLKIKEILGDKCEII